MHWLLILLVCFSASSISFAQENFTHSDFYEVSYSVDPIISEDGKFIAYRQIFANKKQDRLDFDYKITDINTSSTSLLPRELRPLYWIGKELLVKKSIEGITHFGLYNLSKKSFKILFKINGTEISKLKLSKNMKYAIFTKINTIEHKLEDIDIEVLSGIPGLGEISYRTSNYINNGSTTQYISKLYIKDILTGEEKEIAHPIYKDIIPFSQSYILDDDRGIVYFEAQKSGYHSIETEQNVELFKSKVISYEIKSGKLSVLNIKNAKDHKLVSSISPDGNKLIFLEANKNFGDYYYAMSYDLSSFDLKTGEKKTLVKNSKKFDISGVHYNTWWVDKKLFFSYASMGKNRLAYIGDNNSINKISVESGADGVFSPYTSLNGNFFSFSKNGAVAFLKTSDLHYPEVYIFNFEKKNENRVTFESRESLKNKKISKIEEVFHKSSYDGSLVQGWLVKPPGFNPNKKYPLITYLHGGPIASFAPSLSAKVQLLASKGYIVYYPNYRGSASYGAEFRNLRAGTYSKASSSDVISGVLNLYQESFIDQSLSFAFGSSAGASLSLWLTIESKIFTAVTAMFARTDILSGPSANTESLGFIIKEAYSGLTPWNNPFSYVKDSPYFNLNNKVKTPTLLITGEKDIQTPPEDSIKYFNALKYLGVETELVMLKNTGHGSRLISNMLREVEFMDIWFHKYWH